MWLNVKSEMKRMSKSSYIKHIYNNVQVLFKTENITILSLFLRLCCSDFQSELLKHL